MGTSHAVPSFFERSIHYGIFFKSEHGTGERPGTGRCLSGGDA